MDATTGSLGKRSAWGLVHMPRSQAGVGSHSLQECCGRGQGGGQVHKASSGAVSKEKLSDGAR